MTGVDGDPAAEADQLGDGRRSLVGELGGVGDVLPRYDEDVDGRLRVDVAEGHGVLGLRHDVGRDLPGYDPAEQAVVLHGRHRRMKCRGART